MILRTWDEAMKVALHRVAMMDGSTRTKVVVRGRRVEPGVWEYRVFFSESWSLERFLEERR